MCIYISFSIILLFPLDLLSIHKCLLLFPHIFSILCLLYILQDPRTEALREYSYGIILPIICALGIIGNVLNLIVLTRRNMRGTAYIYMRG